MLCLAWICFLAWETPSLATEPDVQLDGTVKSGSLDNRYTITIKNPSNEYTISSISLKTASKSKWISNIRIDPAGETTLAPGSSRKFTVKFDVSENAEHNAIDIQEFEVVAPGVLIDNPNPTMTVKIAAAKDNSGREAKSSLPILNLLKIEGPQSGTESSVFAPRKWYQVVYKEGDAGFSAQADYGNDMQPSFIASLRISKAPLQIVLGRPFEIVAEVKQRAITKGYRQCYVAYSGRKEKDDPIARFAIFTMGLSGINTKVRGVKDLTVHCKTLPSGVSRYTKGGPLVEKDETISLHMKFRPDRIEAPATSRDNCTTYYYNVEYESKGERNHGLSSAPPQSVKFTFCKKTDEHGYLHRDEKKHPDPTSGAIAFSSKFQSSIIRFYYNAIHEGDPCITSLPQYQWPAELTRPPRNESSGGMEPNHDSGHGVTPPGPDQPTPDRPTPDRPAPDQPVPDQPNPDNPDPNHPEVARLIGEWITNAKPPEAAVPGTDLRYNGKGKIVGRGSDGVIKALHDDARIDPNYLWANMRNLDSIDHCILGEYVIAMLKKQSIESCRGRYGAVKNLKGMQLNKAKAEVKAAGFQYEVVTGSPAKNPESDGTVERQEPVHSQYMKKGQILKLTVHAPYAQSQAAKNAVKAAQDALTGCDFPLAQRRIIVLHKGESKTSLLNDLAQRRAEYARINQQMKQAAELIRRKKYDQAMQKLESAKGRAECSDQAQEIEKLIKKAGLGQEKTRAEQAQKALESCELQTAHDLISRLSPGRVKKRLQKKFAQIPERIVIADSLHSQAMQKAEAKNYDDAEGLLDQALDAAPCKGKKNQIRKDLEKIKALVDKGKNLRTDIDNALMRCQYQEASTLLERLGEGERKDKLKARLDKGLKKEREFLDLVKWAEHLRSVRKYDRALEFLQQAKAVAVCIQHKNLVSSRINAIQGKIPRAVPRLAGLSPDEARKELQAVGLKIEQDSAGKPPSRELSYKVQESSPKAGTKVKPGTVVTVKVYGKYRKPTPEEQVAATDCSRYKNSEAAWSVTEKKTYCKCKKGYSINQDKTGCELNQNGRNQECKLINSALVAVWVKELNKWICDCPSGHTWDDSAKRCRSCSDWPGSVPARNDKKFNRICICPEGTKWSNSQKRCRRKSAGQHILYRVNVKGSGWLPTVQDGAMAGTTGESRRIEAIKIEARGLPPGCRLRYKVHAKDIGWMKWVGNGGQAGTTGEKRRLEAVRIKLENCPDWRVGYKVYAAHIGWIGPKYDGKVAGTTGQSRRIEAIKAWLSRSQKKDQKEKKKNRSCNIPGRYQYKNAIIEFSVSGSEAEGRLIQVGYLAKYGFKIGQLRYRGKVDQKGCFKFSTTRKLNARGKDFIAWVATSHRDGSIVETYFTVGEVMHERRWKRINGSGRKKPGGGGGRPGGGGRIDLEPDYSEPSGKPWGQ